MALLVLGLLATAVVLGLLMRARSHRRGNRPDAVSVVQSLQDAERLADLIVAAGARRMRAVSRRGGPDWKEW